MKKLTSNTFRFIPAALCLLFCLLANHAGAANKFWDNNTTSAASSGTWDTTSSDWATSSTLTASPTTFANGDFPEFSAGTTPATMTITVPGPVTCAGMYRQNGRECRDHLWCRPDYTFQRDAGIPLRRPRNQYPADRLGRSGTRVRDFRGLFVALRQQFL